MNDLIAVRGEFTAQDWQIGLFAEKDRIAKQYGENGNICSVVSFEYKGSIESLRSYNISERMSYLKEKGRSIGEIVKLKKPVGFVRIYSKIKEVPEKGNENYINLNQMRLSCSSARGRYCVLELRNNNPVQYKFSRGYDGLEDAKRYSFLRGYYELEDAQKEIFGILKSNNTVFGSDSFNYYYIYDTQSNKAYRCYPDIQELKTTTRQSDGNQIITPLYRYIYYGYAEPIKSI